MSTTTPTPPLASGFLAWPAISSMVFLLSAASLLAGVWSLMAPGLGDDSPDAGLGDRFSAIGILHLYHASLLAVGGLLCRWRRGNPDAVGIAMLAAFFAIGTGAGLDTIALDEPGFCLAVGASSLPLLGLCGWWLGSRMLGRWEPWLAIAAGLLVTWHALAPGWCGWAFAARINDVANRDPHGEWLGGLWLSTAVAATLVLMAPRLPPMDGADDALLRRLEMRWLLLLVLLVAGTLHLLLLDHAFTLDRGLGSCLAPIALAMLVGNELRHRAWGDSWRWDVAAVGIPVAATLLAVSARGVSASFPGLVAAPPVTALLVAGAALVLGRTRGRGRMSDLAVGAAMAGVLGWDAGPRWSELNWNVFLLSAPAAMCWLGWRHRRSELVLGAVMVEAYAVVMFPDVLIRLLILNLAPAAVMIASAGATLLALPPRLRFGRGALRLAAWACALGVYHCCWREASVLHAPIIGSALVAALLVGAAWLHRDRGLLLPITVALGAALMWARWAWLGIAAAFALLGAGSWLSWRRLSAKAPEPVLPTLPTATADPAIMP